MKRVVLLCALLGMCFWMAGCGNTAQTAAETESTEAATVAETESTEITTVAETESTEAATAVAGTAEETVTEGEISEETAEIIEETVTEETSAEVYASNKYLSENEVIVPPAPAATQAAVPATPTAQAATVAPAGVIMVGDSRCVQMQAAVGGGGCSWVCENSKEYTWFSETAIPKFDQYVGSGTKVVINMGVNDPEHYAQYAELINAKAAEWAGRGAKTYLVSVNPVWENPYVTQEEVDTFNANVPGMLVGVTWIDTSSWLMTNGYRLVDGLHYDDPTYVNIFNLIMGSL